MNSMISFYRNILTKSSRLPQYRSINAFRRVKQRDAFLSTSTQSQFVTLKSEQTLLRNSFTQSEFTKHHLSYLSSIVSGSVEATGDLELKSSPDMVGKDKDTMASKGDEEEQSKVVEKAGEESNKKSGGEGSRRVKKGGKKSVKNKENIVWIDLEMTGLDPNTDKIMEVACIVTSDELEVLGEMETICIKQPKEILDNMNEWCVNQHGKSGLTQKCLESEITLEDAEQRLKEFVSEYCPHNKCPVAGNSVGTDVTFLRMQMPRFAEILHYRIIDVSSIKELCRRWYPGVFSRVPKKKLSHRALDDIKESIAELEYYRANLMK